MSGLNMYSMAIIMKVIPGWKIYFSIWVSSVGFATPTTKARVWQ